MNKFEPIEHIAARAEAGFSKAAAARAPGAVSGGGGGGGSTPNNEGASIDFAFETFAVNRLPAGSGRDRQTGAAVRIKTAEAPKFRSAAGTALRYHLHH